MQKSHSLDTALTIIGFLMLVLLAIQGIQLCQAKPEKPQSNLAGVVYVVSNDPVENGNAKEPGLDIIVTVNGN